MGHTVKKWISVSNTVALFLFIGTLEHFLLMSNAAESKLHGALLKPTDAGGKPGDEDSTEFGCLLFEDENEEPEDAIPDVKEGNFTVTSDKSSVRKQSFKVGEKFRRRCRDGASFQDGARERDFECLGEGLWSNGNAVCAANHLSEQGQTLVLSAYSSGALGTTAFPAVGPAVAGGAGLIYFVPSALSFFFGANMQSNSTMAFHNDSSSASSQSTSTTLF